ncbi:enoyl-CoA hydratase/isomerase family protein [Aeromicrobium chenweiae]|uniref:Enoyl-CoA hydratase n=1 Tax=Aeromicrobium chenweiae TaxID=2079793 RepID=A0A2S0WRN6_9ACTN|nr:enoyl-CoA hydratase/isomerase family protein [Aeromicrobium chenweiae]AWB93982.1 enoyl-CoA hydratase [Aeromicrobium chenweiae]TGN32167.1 enoyl-CoA hydratase/isomerase family protein [Aeromicrobium chenweiae]
MDYQDITVETREEGITWLTLNRSASMNAYTSLTVQECTHAVGVFAADDSSRVLVITGAGRGFCSGGDVKSQVELEVADTRVLGHATVMREGFHPLTRAMRQLDKPVIGMINGPAMAGGLVLALLTDIRVASDRATFGDPSGSVGLLPDEGGAWLFPRVMGLERALRMTLLAETYGADQALSLGLVSEVVPHDELEDRVLSLARTLAARAPLAVRLAKRMMIRAQESTMSQALDDAELAVMITNDSADFAEGVAAFLGRRAPRFEGR